jgi:hypothetical protein
MRDHHPLQQRSSIEEEEDGTFDGWAANGICRLFFLTLLMHGCII